MVKYVKGGKMIAGKSYVKAADVMLGIPLGTKDGFKYYSTIMGLVAVPDVPDFNNASERPTDYKSIAEYSFDRSLPRPDPIYKTRKTGEIMEASPILLEQARSDVGKLKWHPFLKKYRTQHDAELKGKSYKEILKMASVSYKRYKGIREEKTKKKSKEKLDTLSPDLDAITKKFTKNNDETELNQLLADIQNM